ncbi:FAD dependent oxidoreductase [Diaporthe helianthi]|uniref:FAD dependent oxidoreductase n=1 Tax=Diaporthe helianthi TaxID=158607 RepID=A0A2P5HH45_DIAHE|nr:FAD dependent oxidoreductase [Diaporthe helianthi]
MAPSPLPVANSTDSFWRTELHPLDDHRSTADLPNAVDIAIVGAGYAGASVVYHILTQSRDKGISPPSIVILEARGACSGATGRNGGHLKPDPYNRPASVAISHGFEEAAECASFEAATLSAVKTVIEEEQIDCDFVLTRAVDVLMTDAINDRMKAGFDLLRKGGLSVMNDVSYQGGPGAEQLSGVKGAKGCVSYSAGHLWPYKLIIALLQKAVDAGVNLQTYTPVTGVSRDTDTEGYYTLTTKERGTVRAKKVVYATNGYTSSIVPELENKIVPVKGICSHIVPKKQPAPHLPNSYIIRWSPTEYEYLIPRLDGSIIVGGARESYYKDLDSWYNTVEDDKLITTGGAHHYFDDYMQKNFKGWEDSGAYTHKVWTGIMGYSSDGWPFVGPLPGRPKQLVIAGFTGHGMPQIFLAAKAVAHMALDDVNFKSTGVPRLYELTQERLDSKKNVILESWAASKPPEPKL